MFSPAFTGSGAPLLVTERSARALTLVVAVAELFPGHGSNVSLVAVAVLLSVVPFRVLALTLTTSLNVASAPAPKLAVAPTPKIEIVQLIAPLPPTIGVTQVHAAGEASETNVVPDGTRSATVTAVAASGPAFETWMRYVRFVPGATGSGEPVLVID